MHHDIFLCLYRQHVSPIHHMRGMGRSKNAFCNPTRANLDSRNRRSFGGVAYHLNSLTRQANGQTNEKSPSSTSKWLHHRIGERRKKSHFQDKPSPQFETWACVNPFSPAK